MTRYVYGELVAGSQWEHCGRTHPVVTIDDVIGVRVLYHNAKGIKKEVDAHVFLQQFRPVKR